MQEGKIREHDIWTRGSGRLLLGRRKDRVTHDSKTRLPIRAPGPKVTTIHLWCNWRRYHRYESSEPSSSTFPSPQSDYQTIRNWVKITSSYSKMLFSYIEASLSNIAALLVLTFLLYAIVLVYYRLYLSPLSKFPGPKIAAVTLWTEFYYDAIIGGQFQFKIKEWHEIYGMWYQLHQLESEHQALKV